MQLHQRQKGGRRNPALSAGRTTQIIAVILMNGCVFIDPFKPLCIGRDDRFAVILVTGCISKDPSRQVRHAIVAGLSRMAWHATPKLRKTAVSTIGRTVRGCMSWGRFSRMFVQLTDGHPDKYLPEARAAMDQLCDRGLAIAYARLRRARNPWPRSSSNSFHHPLTIRQWIQRVAAKPLDDSGVALLATIFNRSYAPGISRTKK